MVPDSCHLSLRSTVQKHTSIGILVHLLLLTVHPESVKPGSTPRMVLNGLRSPIASALPDLRVPVRSVRPAARLRPLNNVILVFMVADCCPDLALLSIPPQMQEAASTKAVTKLSLLSKFAKGNLGIYRTLEIVAHPVEGNYFVARAASARALGYFRSFSACLRPLTTALARPR